MPKHIHADLITEYARLSHITDRPWEYFEIKYLGEWTSLNGEITFYSERTYRLKPRTIKIGEYDVPEPVREPLEYEQVYYCPDIEEEKDGLYWDNYWSGSSCDYVRLERGLIHLDIESAIIHAKALISLTQK
ncbi:hypothetical protein [Xenorhabdus ehlersii]|uniref:Uncharacterized protein n=1 Tax=Xenorhabdus ehlersii TaxID=290111 RepID=A0A2D0IKZ5_9GAMM|nr:hypothetical protein [Xenorhabdus ehlersii]PHM22366.1 hypothetical protein Xehl_03710 [Xenorhabdus ehlersii]RKE90548.1 hypothetical protein BDE27_2422 [Xenorhabdus ehlersii]